MTRYDCVQEWVVECPWTCSWWNKQQTSLCSSSIPEMAEYATKSLMKCNLSYKSNMNLKHSYLYVSYKIIKSCNTSTSGILTWGLHWMQRLLLTISLPATLPSDPRQQTQETSVISHTETSHMPAKKNCQLRIAHSIKKKYAPKNSTFGKRVCESSLILCKSINVAVRWYLRAKQPTSRRIVEMRDTTIHHSHHHQPSAFGDFQRVLTQWKTQSNHIFSHLCHVVRPLREGFEHPTPAYILT